MSLFSQRIGITAAKKVIQLEDVDEDLKNRLWTLMHSMVWMQHSQDGRPPKRGNANRIIQELSIDIWHNYFKRPIDRAGPTNPHRYDSIFGEVRKFYFSSQWFEVYDLIDFVVQKLPTDWKADVMSKMNVVLEEESSGYRFVGGQLAPISDAEEVSAIDEAAVTSFASARVHVRRGLELLSDRQAPDYRNTIKEAVSAVESVVKEVTGNDKGTLGAALNSLERSGQLHPSFKGALTKLYGYSSDAGGIRHALSDQDKPVSYAEAKFMLVACSGFINFVAAKSAEAGVD